LPRNLPESRKLSPENATRVLQKLIDDARVLPGEQWDSPKRQGWKDTARAALERSGVSTSLLQSFDAAQAIAFSGNTTPEELRQMMNSNLSQMAAVLQSGLNELKWEMEEEEPTTTLVNTVKPTVLVFISHSSKDVALATALIELLRAGLSLKPENIRCSSVDGYRLPGGAATEQQLRKEVNTAKAFIGLITKESLVSPYVMFELGARWGAELHMLPLLAGVDPSYVKGPLAGINALSCSSEAQVYQMLADIGAELNLSVSSPASNVAYVKKIVELCR
jgi:TIR domain